jgi:serine/threonine protein phosphatase 1
MDELMPEVLVSAWTRCERLKPGRQVFAIGDVHGQAEAFAAMLEAMALVADETSCLVLLGDLIDRGPQSVETLEIAHRAGAGFGSKEWLLGNHDLFFHAVAATADPAAWAERRLIARTWVVNGGGAFLDELAVDHPFKALDALVDKIGLQAVAAYEGAKTHVEIGNMLFVHAGIQPRASLGEWFERPKFDNFWLERDDEHWAWIRQDFYMHEGPYECDRFVVHGHTPEASILGIKGNHAVPGLLDRRTPSSGSAFLNFLEADYRQNPLHQVDGWRLGLDGTQWPVPMVVGAEIEDGRYRIYMCPV